MQRTSRTTQPAARHDQAVAVYDGETDVGDIIERADRAGFDAVDATGKLIGTFATRLAASRAIPAGGDQ